MLKITSGIYGGRKLVQPKTNKTRPVMERTRHAIFQVLGDITGLDVLDLYAGSGALGLEALSLGANSAVFVDTAKVAIDSIKQNIQHLELEAKAAVVKSTVEHFLQTNTSAFDVVFFDPPYAEFKVEILEIAAERLIANGIVVVSCSMQTTLPDELGKAKLIKIKKYSDTQIAYYKLNS